MSVRLAIDAMGGDHGLTVTVPAALSFLQSHPDAELLLVGRPDEVEGALQSSRQAGGHGSDPALSSRIRVVPASEVIRMDDNPVQALRNRRNSSMRIAIEQVKAGEADACVSAGNTGALMAISRFVLKTLPGIDRPAIATQLPTQKGGFTTMLDLGANVDCEPTHLLQFAIMGSALASVLDGTERPSVGLLNIGEELIKGMIGAFLKQELSRSWFTKLGALCVMPALKRFRQRVDHRRYNGACLIGLRGIVLKSHGSADVLAYEAALRRAYDAARNGLLGRIEAAMAAASPAGHAASPPPLS